MELDSRDSMGVKIKKGKDGHLKEVFSLESWQLVRLLHQRFGRKKHNT
jgi:hypothetical protein